MILEELTTSPAEFTSRTGWSLRPEGLCKGDLCVPASDIQRNDGDLDVTVLADTLGMPLVRDDATGVHALGPAALGRSLNTAVAPELELPNAVDGNPFRLSSLHGRKVLLVAWASW